jgi:predicted nucleic acid-binding protein
VLFVLDTNIYIDAFTRGADASAFRAFHAAGLSRLILSAVVVHELLVGARGAAQRRQLAALVEAFRSRRRLHVPSLATWQLAASFDHDLRELGGFAGSLSQRSFSNDLLLAASARELGATIVTRNIADFALIGRVAPIKVAAPWPAAD